MDPLTDDVKEVVAIAKELKKESGSMAAWYFCLQVAAIIHQTRQQNAHVKSIINAARI